MLVQKKRLLSPSSIQETANLARFAQHEAPSSWWDVLPEPYPLPFFVQPHFMDLPICCMATVAAPLPRGISCVEAQHCSPGQASRLSRCSVSMTSRGMLFAVDGHQVVLNVLPTLARHRWICEVEVHADVVGPGGVHGHLL